MVTKVIVPKLGLDTEPFTLIEWRVGEGGRVEKGTVILLVETAKMINEIEAEASGFLHILLEVGKEAPVGSVAGLIAETKEELEALQSEMPKEITRVNESIETPEGEGIAPAVAVVDRERVNISPLARKMAKEYMIDIRKVAGTGPGGRINKSDIEREIEAKKKADESLKEVSEIPPGKEVLFSKRGRKIAERLTQSKRTIPHFYLSMNVDMTKALAWREAYNQKNQTRISINDLIIMATSSALTQFPRLNSCVFDDRVILHDTINIGVAVGTDEGILVPAIPNSDQKDIQEISRLSREKIENAQEGVLKDPCPGTFTISNLGMYSVSSFIPIINPPECAILGVGNIEKRVVSKDGSAISIRDMMTLVLACDHRAVDGIYGAKFLKAIQNYLENFPL